MSGSGLPPSEAYGAAGSSGITASLPGGDAVLAAKPEAREGAGGHRVRPSRTIYAVMALAIGAAVALIRRRRWCLVAGPPRLVAMRRAGGCEHLHFSSRPDPPESSARHASRGPAGGPHVEFPALARRAGARRPRRCRRPHGDPSRPPRPRPRGRHPDRARGPGHRRQQVDDDTVDRTLEVLRRRVDQLGVAEPSLQRRATAGSSSSCRASPTRTRRWRSSAGRPSSRSTRPRRWLPAIERPPPEATATARYPREELVLPDEYGGRLRLGPAPLTGATSAGPGRVRLRWQVEVDFEFRGEGPKWAALTGAAACAPPGDPARRIAIVLDREVISSPQVAAGDPLRPGHHRRHHRASPAASPRTRPRTWPCSSGPAPCPCRSRSSSSARSARPWATPPSGQRPGRPHRRPPDDALHDRLLPAARRPGRGRPGRLRRHQLRRPAADRRHADPARHRRLRAGHRHGRRRQRAGLRADQGGARGRGHDPPGGRNGASSGPGRPSPTPTPPPSWPPSCCSSSPRGRSGASASP